MQKPGNICLVRDASQYNEKRKVSMEKEMRRKGIDRRQQLVEVSIERRKNTERRFLENRRSGTDRRVVLTGRCRFIDRRDRAYFKSHIAG